MKLGSVRVGSIIICCKSTAEVLKHGSMGTKVKVLIKDWYILPSWGRGLAIGTIIGAILTIPAAFLVRSYATMPIPFLILATCSITGLLLTRKRKSFGLLHK